MRRNSSIERDMQDTSVESPENGLITSSALLPEARSESTEDGGERMGWTRLLVVGVLLTALVFVVIDSFGPGHIHSAVLDFLGWVEEHPGRGVLAVIIVYIVATILFVPGSILTFGAGYAFGAASENKLHGVMLASAAVFVGASLGSISTFLLGRYLFRDCVIRLASNYPLFQAIDRALQSNGLKIMVLLRLSPLVPYNALDYMSGITAIPLWAYSLALIGLLPGTVMLSFVGASASSLTDTSATGNKTMNIITVVSGVLFAGIGVYVASYYSKLELEKILENDRHERNLSMSEMGQTYHDGDDVAAEMNTSSVEAASPA